MWIKFLCWLLGHDVWAYKSHRFEGDYIITEKELMPYCRRCAKMCDGPGTAYHEIRKRQKGVPQ